MESASEKELAEPDVAEDMTSLELKKADGQREETPLKKIKGSVLWGGGENEAKEDSDSDFDIEQYILRLEDDDGYDYTMWGIPDAGSYSDDEESGSFPITTNSCRLLPRDDAISYSRMSLRDSSLHSIPEICPGAITDADAAVNDLVIDDDISDFVADEDKRGPVEVTPQTKSFDTCTDKYVPHNNSHGNNKHDTVSDVVPDKVQDGLPSNPQVVNGKMPQYKCTRTSSSDTNQTVKSNISEPENPDKTVRRKKLPTVTSTDTDSTSVSGKGSRRKVLRNFSQRSVSSLVLFFDKRKRGIKKRFSSRKVIDLDRLKTSETQTQAEPAASPDNPVQTNNTTPVSDRGAIQNGPIEQKINEPEFKVINCKESEVLKKTDSEEINTTDSETINKTESEVINKTKSEKINFTESEILNSTDSEAKKSDAIDKLALPHHRSDTSLSSVSSPSRGRSEVSIPSVSTQSNATEDSETRNKGTPDSPVQINCTPDATERADGCESVEIPTVRVDETSSALKQREARCDHTEPETADTENVTENEPENAPEMVQENVPKNKPENLPTNTVVQATSLPVVHEIVTAPLVEENDLKIATAENNVDTGFESEESVDSGCPIAPPISAENLTEVVADVHVSRPDNKSRKEKVKPASDERDGPVQLDLESHARKRRPKNAAMQTTSEKASNSRASKKHSAVKERRKPPDSIGSSRRNSEEFDEQTLTEMFTAKENKPSAQGQPVNSNQRQYFPPMNHIQTEQQRFPHPMMMMPEPQSYPMMYQGHLQDPYDFVGLQEHPQPTFPTRAHEPRFYEPMRTHDPYSYHPAPPPPFISPPPFHPTYQPPPMFMPHQQPQFRPNFGPYDRPRMPLLPPTRPHFNSIEMPRPQPRRVLLPPQQQNNPRPEFYMRTWPNEIENNNHKLNFNNNLHYNENDHSERFNSRRVSFGEDLIHEDYDQSNYEPSVYDLYHNQQKNCGEFGPTIERRGRPGLSRQGSVKGESFELNRPSAHQEYFNKPVRTRVPETYEDFVQRLSRELRDPELGLLEYNFRCDIMTCLNRLNPVVRWGVLYEFYEEAMDRFERILNSNLSPVSKENEWKNMLDTMVDDIHYFNVDVSTNSPHRYPSADAFL